MTASDMPVKEKCPQKGRAARWIWALALIVAVAIVSTSGLRIYRVLSSAAWPTTTGTVTFSALEHTPMGRTVMKYELQLRYHYKVQGIRYESDRLTFAGSSDYVGRTGAEKRVQRALAAYPEGASVTVHYQPAGPGVAVLETDVPGRLYKLLLAGAALAILSIIGFRRRWTLQTDHLSKPFDPHAPMTVKRFVLGAMGLATCVAIAWVWWELIKKYAGL